MECVFEVVEDTKLLFIGGSLMAKHSGGKVGKAAKTLATSKSKKEKSKAAKILNKHKEKMH
jgi:hypothetical protein